MDLTTTYMGMDLKNPLVPSASPLSKSVSGVRALEDAGASAVVLYSLFEEQITHESRELDHYLVHGTESFAEALSYFPDLGNYNLTPDQYLEHVRAVKEAVDIPVIGSLNGVSPGGWVEYARRIEQAGADGLELNVYYLATDPDLGSEQVERIYLDTLSAVKGAVKIPVAIKIGPYFSALAHTAGRLDRAGADALVLFNRFYQPDINLEDLTVVPDVVLSYPAEARLPMRWIAVLHGRVQASLAATTGIHTHEDVLKMVMVGADVAMMTSALLRNGPGHIRGVLDGMRQWMEEHEYESVRQMKGSMSHRNCPEPAAFERANYMKALASLD